MRSLLKHLILLTALAAAMASNIVMAKPGAGKSAVEFKTIYQFTGIDAAPGDLVSDRNGGFFGATQGGGNLACYSPYGCGTVYHLNPPATPGAAWTQETIHSFAGYPDDGQLPFGPLVAGTTGTVYGVTQFGGNLGCGTVYSLRAPAELGGAWTETILYNFTGDSDGSHPVDLIAGPDGVLYGTTLYGGGDLECGEDQGCGAIFSLTQPAAPGGSWTISVLYNFEGTYFEAGATSVILGPNQVLYGTTPSGVIPCEMDLCGSVFSLTPPVAPGGPWIQTVLHAFVGGNGDGSSPNASLVLGTNGTLYGTTYEGEGQPCGDQRGCGTVFELTPPVSPGGDWTETLIFTFPPSPAPNAPQSGVILGGDGTLYGLTPIGGIAGCQDDFGCGAVFALRPPALPGGTWTETLLHRFTGGADGAEPYGNLVMGKDGALFGTTIGFGISVPGTVFILHP